MFGHLASGENGSAPTRGAPGQAGENPVSRFVDFPGGGGTTRTTESLEELGGVDVLVSLGPPSLNSLGALIGRTRGRGLKGYPGFLGLELKRGVRGRFEIGREGSHGKLGIIAERRWRWRWRWKKGVGKKDIGYVNGLGYELRNRERDFQSLYKSHALSFLSFTN